MLRPGRSGYSNQPLPRLRSLQIKAPFGLSLSKAISFLEIKQQGTGFDKLSPNEWVIQPDCDRP